jgi:two-component system, cell cycle response regulator DivK
MPLPVPPTGPLVLLVDDFEDARLMYGQYLNHVGYRVIEAATGEEALDIATRDTPDVILLDMLLPGVDGWEVTRRLRNAESTRAIPIIALTAHTLDSERDRSARAGCDLFLAKPCLPADVAAAIARVLTTRATPAGTTS